MCYIFFLSTGNKQQGPAQYILHFVSSSDSGGWIYAWQQHRHVSGTWKLHELGMVQITVVVTSLLMLG